jgi:hypothetical protein
MLKPWGIGDVVYSNVEHQQPGTTEDPLNIRVVRDVDVEISYQTDPVKWWQTLLFIEVTRKIAVVSPGADHATQSRWTKSRKDAKEGENIGVVETWPHLELAEQSLIRDINNE